MTTFIESQLKNGKMYGIYEPHICEENENRLIYKKNDEWVIEADDGYDNINDTKYCPFCGAKLK